MTRYVKGVPFDIERCTKAVPFLPKKGVGPRDGASPHKTLLNHSWGGGGVTLPAKLTLPSVSV